MIYYTRTCKVTGLEQFIAALATFASSHRLGALPRGQLYERVRRGLHNFFGLSEITVPKHAISMDQLYTIYFSLDFSVFADARDWCAYVFAFFGLLRLREYTDGRLHFQHVSRHSWGIQLTIPFSKTSLQPAHVKLAARADRFCPVKAYDSYVLHIHTRLRLPSTAFFRDAAATTAALSSKSYIQGFRTRVAAVLHIDATPFAGHSFRRGGTTALFLAGVPETVIASHGRWKSDTYRRYFEWTSTQQLLPTRTLYTHTRHKYA